MFKIQSRIDPGKLLTCFTELHLISEDDIYKETKYSFTLDDIF